MPRNVRNFWIECDVDGRATRFASGPANRTGGFDLTVKMRSFGGILEIIDVLGRAHPDGTLTLRVYRNAPQRELLTAIDTAR